MSNFSSISIPTNRFTAMLKMIPRAPESISTERLQEKLWANGFEVDLRTVQRNLKDLVESGEFGLTKEKNGRKSAHWQYAANAPATIFPSLDDHTALAFQLADAFLQSLMPPETVNALRPFVEEAGRHLSKRRQDAAGKWQDKIHVFPQGMRRKAPRILPVVRETVYHSLLEEKPLRLKYLSRSKREASEFVISPLGLVVRDYLSYLYVLTWEKKKILTFAMNRILSAEILEDAVADKPPADFSLAGYENHVSLQISGSPKLDLKLRIGSILTYSLKECPLANRQILTKDLENPGGSILSAEVPNTVELRQWIRSMGSNAEVLEPNFLRKEMAEEVAKLVLRYGCLPSIA